MKPASPEAPTWKEGEEGKEKQPISVLLSFEADSKELV